MPMAYQIREHSISLLPKGAENLRILHFSDLHLTPRRKRLIADIESWARLKPDLVISTGDFIAHNDGIEPLINALKALFDIPGLFVFGSNDYYAPKIKNPLSYLFPDKGVRKLGDELPWRELRDGLLKRGWLDLNQSKTMVNIRGHNIELRGTDDAHLNRDDYSLVSGPKNSYAELSLGVTHAPYMRILDAMAADSIDLIFAGHTHGGQVRLPLPAFMGGSRALTTNCDLPTWRSRGLSVENGKPLLHVSAGIGTSPFAPIRVGTRPEATLIHLVLNKV